MKKQVTICVFCLLYMASNALFGQTDDYNGFRAKMSSVFQYVNKEKVPTGILVDYGLQLVNPDTYNGVPTETNSVNFSIWKQLYFGMYDSQINGKVNLQEPQILFNNIKGSKALAVMYYQYNKLADDAVSRGLLRFENEQIKEVLGTASPYLSKELFAVTPCETIFESASVTFVFDRQNYVSNTGLTVNKLEINYNDESGYREVQWGIPISYAFSSGGEKDIYFRLTFSNGKVLSSHVEILVASPTVSTRADGKEIVRIDIPATGKHSGGTMQVLFCNGATGGKFVRPLVIAEDMNVPLFFEGQNIDLEYLGEVSEFSDAVNQLSQIYDIIYIDNKNGLDDINRNAHLFEDAIKMVDNNRFAVSDSTYVIGLGMGGLVARVGLNMMEAENYKHRVRKLVSINTPYRGLNIPAGLQAFVHQMQGLKFGKSAMGDLSDQIDEMGNLLDSKAMQQMLIYCVGSNIQYNNYEYQNFMNSPNMTRTPLGCQTVAISGGSRTGNSLFGPETLLIEYHNSSELLNHWFLKLIALGGMDLNVDITAKTVADRGNVNIYDGRIYIKKKILFWSVNINVSHKLLDSTSDMYPVDGASGNFLSMKNLIKEGGSMGDFLKIDKFCCVPTVSALGLVDWKKQMSSDLTATPINSICDRYYISGENNDYMGLAAFKDFLISELAPKIVGSTVRMSQDTKLYVDNMPDISMLGMSLIQYDWSFQNNNFKVMSKKKAEAVIRPLHFGVTDVVSVAVRIPMLDLNFNVPSIGISSNALTVEGDTYISELKNHYQLSETPSCDTLFWRASEGVIISKQKGNYVVAHTEKELAEAWIEGVVLISGVENVFRKNLISKGLKSIKLNCRRRWIGKDANGNKCQKYAYYISYDPSDLPAARLDFCWGNTVEKNSTNQNVNTYGGISDRPVRPMGGTGLAKLITRGGIEAFGRVCLAREIINDGVLLDTGKILRPDFPLNRDSLLFPHNPIIKLSNGPGGPINPPIAVDDDEYYSEWGNAPDRVVVLMPILEKGETASGILRCSVSDYLGNKYSIESEELTIEGPKNSYYAPSPNPVSSVLSIRRITTDDSAISTFSVSAPERVVVALYNNFGLVRSVTFDSNRASVDMNVADLTEGTYYLNIIKNDKVIENQIVFIKH